MGGSPTPSVLCALAFYFVFLLGLDRLVLIVRAQNGTTPPSEVSALNSVFNQWKLSVTDNQWNISGEPCSGTAINSTDITSGDYNRGIKCDCNGIVCHITKLKVVALDVAGGIPKELWSLTSLTYLNLNQNYLTGSLSSSIANLSQMQTLNLASNALSGEVPKELGKLTNLTLFFVKGGCAASVGIRALVPILTMAEGRAGGRGGRGGRTAYVDEVYERDDAARDARAEERFQRLKLRVASVIQRLEALEVGRLPRRQPFKPSLPMEVDFSDGVSIIKPLPGNHQSTGRTRAVKIDNRDSRLWESGLKINFPEFQKGMTPEKILKVGAREKKIIEEILVEGDVGDSIDDVLEEESDKIFFDNNTSSFQSEIYWESPPKFDEYPDEEETIIHKVEENVKDESVEVSIEKKVVTIVDKVDGLNSFNGFLNLEKRAIGICPSLGFKLSEYMDPFWRIIEHSTRKNIWISILEQGGTILLPVLLVFEDYLKFPFEKINLKNKLDADKFRRNQLCKLEDEFLQDGENDAVQKYEEYKLITHYFEFIILLGNSVLVASCFGNLIFLSSI